MQNTNTEEQEPKPKKIIPSKDPEYVRKYSQQYYLKNKERINAANMDAYYKNKDYWKEYQKTYQKERYEKIKHMTTCETCNKTILNTSLTNHLKTKSHARNSKNNI